MSDVSWSRRIAVYVRGLQIIVSALVLGCIAAAVVLPNLLQPPRPNQTPFVTLVAYVFFGGIVLARLIVPTIVVAKGRRAILNGTFPVGPDPAIEHQDGCQTLAELPDDVYRLIELFQQKTIVGAALLEGCALFLAIAYSRERDPIALVLLILLILGVAAHFPTASRVTGWIETQKRRLDEERQFAR